MNKKVAYRKNYEAKKKIHGDEISKELEDAQGQKREEWKNACYPKEEVKQLIYEIKNN